MPTINMIGARAGKGSGGGGGGGPRIPGLPSPSGGSQRALPPPGYNAPAVPGISLPQVIRREERLLVDIDKTMNDMRNMFRQAYRQQGRIGGQGMLPPPSGGMARYSGGGAAWGGGGGRGGWSPPPPVYNGRWPSMGGAGPRGPQSPGAGWGGGGGGAGGGGGGGGFGAGAFRALGGMPGPLGRMGRIGVRGGMVGLAAKAAWEAATLPQTYAGWVRNSMSGAERAMSLKERTYEYGRTGGFSGEGLRGRLFPGGYQTPEAMKQLGMTPESMLDSLDRYGIRPRSTSHALGLATSFRHAELSSAFSGMGAGTVESAQRQFDALGVGNSAGAKGISLASTSRLLENAIERGMDRTAVLGSIRESLDTIAGTGAAGIATESLQQMLARMFNSDMPGARTGAVQAQALSGSLGAIGSLGSDPVRSIMMSGAMSKAGLTTDASIKDFLGPELHEQLSRNPGGTKILEGIKDEMKAGRTGTAMMYVREALKGDPSRYNKIIEGELPNMPGSLKTLMGAQTTGQGLSGYLANQGQGVSGSSGTLWAAQNNSLDYMRPGGTNKGEFSLGEDYTAILRAAGVPEDHIPHIIAAGKKYNVNPMVIAAQAKAESQFNNVQSGANKNGTFDSGPMQINSATASRWGVSADQLKDLGTNYDLGARHMAGTRGSGGVENMVRGYNPGAADREWSRFQDANNQLYGGNNIPSDVYAARAGAAQAELAGSATSFHEFANNIDAVNSALATLVTNVRQVNFGIGRQLPQSGASSYP